MRNEPAAAGHEIDDRRRAIHRLQRAEPKTVRHVLPVERLKQVGERGRGLEVAPERAEVHARQDHLLEAPVRSGLDATQHLGNGPTAPSSSRARDDAVGAPFVAAGLHGDRVNGAARGRRLDRHAAGTVARLVSQGIEQRSDVGCERVLAVVRHHRPDTGHPGQLVGGARRVAPGDHDSRVRIAAGNSANRLPGRGRRAEEVTEQELTTMRSACSGETGRPPQARRSLSMHSESA